SVRDDAGQLGFSPPTAVTVPERAFGNPLARALIEQRRILAMDANRVPDVIAALDILTLAPERFIPDLKTYITLRSAYYRTVNARSDGHLLEVVDLLWHIAL